MHGVIVMKSFRGLALLLITVFTAARAENPAASKGDWPGVAYAHVVAYLYDPEVDDRGNSIVFADGTHHRGIIAPYTRNLMPAQVKRLEALLNPEKEPAFDKAKCFIPHHGIVFYDEDWKPVASLDLCLTCVDFRARPAHPLKDLDWQAFAEFFRKLGMPVLEDRAGPDAYAKFFARHHLTTPEEE